MCNAHSIVCCINYVTRKCTNLSLFINYFIVSYKGDIKTVIRHEMGENGLKKVSTCMYIGYITLNIQGLKIFGYSVDYTSVQGSKDIESCCKQKG